MKSMLVLGKEILAAQPFSVLVGAELLEFGQGGAEVMLRITEQHKQHHGFVHGGVIGSVADTALSFAGGSVLGTDVVTSDLLIHFVRPAIGDALVARATVVSSTKRRAVCRCDVFVKSERGERLCASAQGSITKLASDAAGRAPLP